MEKCPQKSENVENSLEWERSRLDKELRARGGGCWVGQD